MHAEGDAVLAREIARQAGDYTQISLVTEAVRDAQGTIRAVDTKVGILLAALAIPLPYVVTAVSAAERNGLHLTFGTVCGSLAATLYVVAGFVAIRALIGIGNAAAHVKRSERLPDVFYLGGLYKLGWIDAMFNRRGIVSRRELEEIAGAVPRDAERALKVLVNELMTLAYVRDVKLHRQKTAFELAASAFILGLFALMP